MAKDIVQVEIKKIPIRVQLDGISAEEMNNLALAVENEMMLLQEEGEVDTLKQAIRAALFFATKTYVQYKRVQNQQKETDKCMDSMISRLEQSLKTLEEPHE